MSETSPDAAAAEVVELLARRGLTLATAESLTGGGLGGLLTAVPGASRVYVGGVVSYATRVKIDLLGVPAAVVAAHGVVSAPCAEAMAERARALLGADVGVATTGVAGPDPQEGRPVGTVFVAVAADGRSEAEELRLPGGREEVRAATCRAAVRLLAARLAR